MNDLYLEHLDRSGFLRGSQVEAELVMAAPVGDLMSLAESLTAAAKSDLFDPVQSIYANWASLSLSGSPQACRSLPCRIGRAERLGRFAALYSDCVFVHNEFADYVAHPPRDDAASISAFKREFVADLSVMANLRPVIEAGHVIPVTQAKYYCRHCLVTHSFGADAGARFEQLEANLKQEYFAKTALEIGKATRGYTIVMKGPDDLVPHGEVVWLRDAIPEAVLKRRSVTARIAAGETVALSAAIRRELGMHANIAAGVWRDIMYELTMSQLLGTTFLTDKAVHVRMLETLAGDVDIERRNLIAEELLTSHVPFVNEVPLEQLLTLREREAESFVSFRSALASAIDTYKQENSSFTELHARQLYSDVLAPKLAALDVRVGLAKKDLARSFAGTVAGWTGAISFGLYSGILPPKLTAAVAAAGAIKVGADSVASLLKASTEQTAKPNDMYFLWRVRQLAR